MVVVRMLYGVVVLGILGAIGFFGKLGLELLHAVLGPYGLLSLIAAPLILFVAYLIGYGVMERGAK